MSTSLRMLSLCSGIGGADLAAEWTGAIEVVGQVEIDLFCQAVLAKHWPKVKRMADIKEVEGHEFGPIDIIAAGIPCQGNSLAGKRKGAEDERNLWPDTKRIISTAQPRWLVVENVPGLLSVDDGQLFATILDDLDTLGYRVGWFIYGACEIGAPHQRERIFLVAHLSCVGSNTWRTQSERQQGQSNPDSDGSSNVAHPTSRESGWLQQRGLQTNTRASSEEMAHSQSTECQRSRDTWSGRNGLTDSSAVLAHTYCERQQELDTSASNRGMGQHTRLVSTSRVSGATQPSVCRSIDGLSARLDSHQWPAHPGEEQKEGEPSRTITKKLPYRNRRLKALGNAIVPQQIYPLFYSIVQIEMEVGGVA